VKTIFAILCLLSVWVPSHAASLYKEDTFQSLVGDRRAYRVGDSLTVLVYENSTASASSDTNGQKSAGAGLSIKTPTSDKAATIDLNDDFSGKGKVQRSGKLTAQLSVTVQQVVPNGDLMIAGNQIIELNNEKQEIKLEGRVRPQDISETNTIASSRIAEAKISYIGDGFLSQRQTPGFLSRILSILGIL
jgi:flagellar L-ring protein precursor FlgH